MILKLCPPAYSESHKSTASGASNSTGSILPATVTPGTSASLSISLAEKSAPVVLYPNEKDSSKKEDSIEPEKRVE